MSQIKYMSEEESQKRADELYAQMTWDERILQMAATFPNGVKRLKIGNMQQGECLHGVKVEEATSFPQAIALGCTWNPELIKEMSSEIAKEARALGIHHCHTPMLGVARDIRWGRTEEAYGEDPYLVSQIGSAFIRGLQGEGKERFGPNKIMSEAKHFVADAEPLSGNNGASVDISERLLHEVHLVPFREAVEVAKVGAIMPAHHALNGIPCHMNKYLLQTILRDTYGFDGIVESDNGDIRCISTLMGIAETTTDGAIMALEAGVDMELAFLCPMGKNRAYGPGLLQAVKEGKVEEALIEKAVKRVLKRKGQLGLLDVEEFDDGEKFFEFQGDSTGDVHIHYADINRSFGVKRPDYKEVLYRKENDELARKVAQQAITLLKNDGNLLPLDPHKKQKIAVIGPNANQQLLGGYSTPQPRYFITLLDGIKEMAGAKCEVNYCRALNPDGFEAEEIEAAVAMAKENDVIILAVGGNELTCKENQDVDTLAFVGDQEELIQKVYAANSNVVLALFHGRPNSIEWESIHIPAILECFYLGQETGHAFADVLFGAYNPGGKLSVTIPRNVGQCPAFYNKYPFGRQQNYYKSSPEPLYPFGFGLSYTSFSFTDLKVSATKFRKEEGTTLFVTVTNTGDRVGDEVVQVYIHDELCSMVRPCKELKAFQRVTLQPAEKRELAFPIAERMLEFWGENGFTTEPGEFTLMVGGDSVNTQSVTIELVD